MAKDFPDAARVLLPSQFIRFSHCRVKTPPSKAKEHVCHRALID
jgi:hypothetical protein